MPPPNSSSVRPPPWTITRSRWRAGANGTDAHQTNKNLILSDGVEVDSKPQLEIFADDVKCSHGAADGQLAEDAIFYLKSRGLDEVAARTLLTYGFAREVLGGI